MTEPVDPFASSGPNDDGYDPGKFYVDPDHNILRYRNGSWRGKPYLPHPETGKLCAWGRPSSLGKPLDDASILGNWRLVKTAEGMTARKDLQYRMASLDQADGADFMLKLEIANDAIDAAGGADGRTRGTALHAITERLDRGEPVDLAKLPDDLAATARAYAELVKDLGLSFCADPWRDDDDPDNFMRERFVINTETMTAGTFDHIAWRDCWDLPRLLDAKSSKDPEKYGHGFTIQMADYAYARHMLPIGWDFRTSTATDLLPMPEVDKRWGAIVWIRDGQAELLDVKLDAGWHATTTLLVDIRAWRARKDLVTPHDPERNRQPTPAEALFTAAPGEVIPREPLVFRSGVIELVQAGPYAPDETKPRDPAKYVLHVEPLPGRKPIPVDPTKHGITNTAPPAIPRQRTAPPIISIDDPITVTMPDGVSTTHVVEDITPTGTIVTSAKVDPGRDAVLAERAAARDVETRRRAIAVMIREAKSRAELAAIYERHSLDWWDGATTLGNQLWPA